LFLLDFKGVLHRSVFSQDQYNAFFHRPAAAPFNGGQITKKMGKNNLDGEALC
jgi:hypothetical protein